MRLQTGYQLALEKLNRNTSTSSNSKIDGSDILSLSQAVKNTRQIIEAAEWNRLKRDLQKRMDKKVKQILIEDRIRQMTNLSGFKIKLTEAEQDIASELATHWLQVALYQNLEMRTQSLQQKMNHISSLIQFAEDCGSNKCTYTEFELWLLKNESFGYISDIPSESEIMDMINQYHNQMIAAESDPNESLIITEILKTWLQNRAQKRPIQDFTEFQLLFRGQLMAILNSRGLSRPKETSRVESFRSSGSSNNIPWRYSTITPKSGSVSDRVLYVFHGLGDNDRSWTQFERDGHVTYSQLLYEYWTLKDHVPPRVVSISFDRSWLLTLPNQKSKSGLLNLFVDEVLPEIERRIGTPKERHLFGHSMGGLNAIVLAQNYPHLFSKVAITSAPIYSVSPFDRSYSAMKAIKGMNADASRIQQAIDLASTYLNESDWQKFSPLFNINLTDDAKKVAYYLSVGTYDPYGNLIGNKVLADHMQFYKFNMIYKQLNGGHRAVDVTSLGEFLVQK